MSSERIGLLIHRLPQLHGLHGRMRRLSELRPIITDLLPANLIASIALAISDAGELLIFADNGATAAKLRQLTPRIMVVFRQRGIEVTAIRIQVQVSIRHNSLLEKRIFLSRAGGEAVAELVSQLQPSPLRSALERLGRRGSDHQDQPLEGV